MNKILEDHFVKTYPKIFRDMYGPMDKTCMHWGITCGDGWFYILDKLCAQIQTHIDWKNQVRQEGHSPHGKTPIPQLVAAQIKEKFGELTFYYDGGDEYCRALVDFAASLSYGTCENCGLMNENVGRTHKSWIQSLCPACAYIYNKEIKQDDKMILLWTKVLLSRVHKDRSWEPFWTSEPTKPVIKRGGKGFKKGKK